MTTHVYNQTNFPTSWDVEVLVDDDGHLNIYITNADNSTIFDVGSGQGDGMDGDQLALRLTTDYIESEQNTDVLGNSFWEF